MIALTAASLFHVSAFSHCGIVEDSFTKAFTFFTLNTFAVMCGHSRFHTIFLIVTYFFNDKFLKTHKSFIQGAMLLNIIAGVLKCSFM